MKRWVMSEQEQLERYIKRLAKEDAENDSIISSYAEFRKLAADLGFEPDPGLFRLYEDNLPEVQEDDFDKRWDSAFGEPSTDVFSTAEFKTWMREVMDFE